MTTNTVPSSARTSKRRPSIWTHPRVPSRSTSLRRPVSRKAKRPGVSTSSTATPGRSAEVSALTRIVRPSLPLQPAPGFSLSSGNGRTPPRARKLKAVQSELKRFEATWRFVAIEIDGMQLPEEAFKEDTLTLKGKQFSSTVRGNTNNGAFKIDPTMNPKTIDITMTDGSGKSVTQKGIYELDGDNQKICISAPGKPRPTEFVTKPDSGRIIEVLKRAKS